MKLRLKKTVLLLGFFTLFLLLTGCTKGVDEETLAALEPITLEYWGVFNTSDEMTLLLSQYQELHPHITINYRKLRFEEYEKELLEAFSEGRGPDIFSIHNTWMEEYKPKLLPAPASTQIPYKFLKGSITKEEVVELRNEPTYTRNDIETLYVPVVADDVLMSSELNQRTGSGKQEFLYGLPLHLDTMVMYYNRDLLNRAGVILPPSDWQQFREAVMAITRINQENGEIIQSAASLGTADNIDRFFDIASLMMMQSGTQMIDSKGNVAFHKVPEGREDIQESPAFETLRFYTDFASPDIDVYTWNDSYENSLLDFLDGKTAFFFGYSYHLPLVKQRAATLSYGVSPVPQIAGGQTVNYANYWVEAVSAQTEHRDETWNLLHFISQPDVLAGYLSGSSRPTPLKSLINTQLEDYDLEPFAQSVLTAKSWYNGIDIDTAENIFATMINSILEDGQENISEKVEFAAQRINQTFR